jgi:beta-glucanase (GH16 family)
MGSAQFHNNAILNTELRNRLIYAILICCALVLGVDGQTPVFKDEFDKTAGTAPDPEKWTPETGGGGWGNEELQFYTGSNENAFHDGRGSLVIKAIKLGSETETKLDCWYGKCQYRSARLITKGKFDFKYGRNEARIKVPRGVGVWPAFWLLGNDIDKTGWPNCGEIDVMEFIGREASTVYGTLHGPGYSGPKSIGGFITLSDGKKVSDDFHVFSVQWNQNEIRWFFDGHNYKTITRTDIPKGTPWVFDHPFFIILNFAVGGKWPGSPDGSTQFPQSMLVDYVRVYELKDTQVK